MTREAQKLEELRLVQQMLRLLGNVPAGELEPVGEPDVCIATPTARIGIEVTELHQRPAAGQSVQRGQESERFAIVAEAQALAEAAGLPALIVTVHFNDRVRVTKRDRAAAARRLQALVADHAPDVDGKAELQTWRWNDPGLCGIRIVRVYRLDDLQKHHWSVPTSGWVQSDLVDELQGAIDEKNVRHLGYMSKCDECWLLLVASGGRPSGFLFPSETTKDHVYRSAFTRTFFMEAFHPQLVELKTRIA